MLLDCDEKLLAVDDFEVVGGEAVEVGDSVINLSFPQGNALAFGVEALLDEGGDGGFVGVRGWRNGNLFYVN